MFFSTKDDYIRDTANEEYDILLFNPEWKVSPAISFVEGKGPCVLACRRHIGGTGNYYIHTPRQPTRHTLPSKQGDQLCHAVMKSRTIKQTKAKKYSTCFQLHSQMGSFKGIDTCDVRSFGRFNFTSLLDQQTECMSIIGKSDINLLLGKLERQKVIRKDMKKAFREDANHMFPEKSDIDHFVHGSTYVPIEDAIHMQLHIGKEHQLKMIFDMRTKNNLPEVSMQARRN